MAQTPEKIMNWENYYRNNSDTDYSHKEVLEYMEALNEVIKIVSVVTPCFNEEDILKLL